MAGRALLDVRGLEVEFDTPRGVVRAVRGASLEVGEGECLAVVGESGSGKSQCFLACLGLLAAQGRASGSACFDGRELVAAPRGLLDEVRGGPVGFVFQDPMNALTPHLTLGRQLGEAVLERGLMSAEAARKRSLELLARVGLPEPEARLRQYPHELSGGQRQRVAIAMALMTDPRLVIADEPTTALDVTVQAQVLEVLRDVRRDGRSLVMITHDLGVVAGIADRVAVMYAGRVVEVAPVEALFASPAHPYTAALLASVPRLSGDVATSLAGIEGQPPRPGEIGAGCSFAPRCTQARDACRTRMPPSHANGERRVECVAPLTGAGVSP
ncbi:MAG: ABC transporter ATP-binding protein [Lysobacterales bacterium]|jgi:oligopeptide transport system ATP-binding protein|nr:MAG: ABC transporter ATP-binding protein [Xanthomonadales bacterium]